MSLELTGIAEGPLLLELLQQAGKIQGKDLSRVFDLQAKHAESLEESLLRSALVNEDDIANAYAEQLMVPIWEPVEGDEEAMERLAACRDILPEKLCRENLVAPIERRDMVLLVAAANPTLPSLFDGLALMAGLRIDVQVARISHVTAAINAVFGTRDVARELAAEVDAEGNEAGDLEIDDVVLDLEKPVPPTREGQIVSLVNHILIEAVRRRASDIHLEPYEDSVRVRVRIDGRLVNLTPPPRSMFIPMVSRLKILSRMDIAERRIPQDGAFSMQTGGNKIDLRVSTIPSVWGEKMVMRLLNKGAIPLEFTKLGFSEQQTADFGEALRSPHGLVFVTGPTGSGKSTTLYTALNMLNDEDTNLVTAEDPVEYRFTGINQIQMKPQVGLTFSSALRSFLRQDPDVIMVGEVRDQETAEICLRAALTGHLVLSTLHTNDALSAVSRLEDMGIEPFLLSATLRLVQAQRLIRRLCPKCKEVIKVPADTAAKLCLSADDVVYGPVGCEACGGQGYKGRLGIFEVIRITAPLRDLIQEHATWKQMHAAAKAEGVAFLAESGVKHIQAGLTSLAEVLTVALAGDD